MLTPIILLLGLAVATCVIAYVSDNLGKKLGKKRVSLWGLRPRQTATLLTMASGLGIMLITLFVLLGLWGPLRHALLSYDRVKADSRALTSQNLALQRNLNLLGVQSKNLETQVVRSQKQASAARHHVSQGNRQLEAVRKNLQVARRARQAAEQAELIAQRGESAARQRAEHAQQRFTAAQSRLNNSQQRLFRVESTLHRARAGLAQTRLKLVSARNGLGQAKVRLSSAKANLRATLGAVKTTMGTVKILSQQVAEQARQVAEQQTKVDQLQVGEQEQKAKVAELQTKRDELQEDIAKLTSVARQYANAAEQLATGQVIVPVSQAFAERRLPPHPSAAEAHDALNDLLAEGKKVVTSFGAQDMVLAPITIETGSRTTLLDQEQILALLVKHLATFDVPVSVRLLAARNHFAGEKEILGRMEAIPQRTAFTRGETIAAAIINGKESDAGIFNRLLTLVNEGEKAARERKVTPPLTPDNPHFYGSHTNERIFKALRDIQAVNGPASVRLVAADEISTVEPMNVRFEVAAQ